MTNIVYLATELNDGTKRDPHDMMIDFSDDIVNGKFKGKKMLIIGLDDSEDGYHILWKQAGMRMSEIVALLECAKKTVLSEMNL